MGHESGRDAGGGGALREGRPAGSLPRFGLEAERLADGRSGLAPWDVRDGHGPVGFRVAIDDASNLASAAPHPDRPEDLLAVLLRLRVRRDAPLQTPTLPPAVLPPHA